MNFYFKVIRINYILIFLFSSNLYAQDKAFSLASPDKNINVTIQANNGISYSISAGGHVLMPNNTLSLEFAGDKPGQKLKVLSSKTNYVDEVIRPYVALKFESVKNTYNSLVLKLNNSTAVEFRAFDDGVAYRLIGNRSDSIKVLNEVFSASIPSDYKLHLQQVDRFKTAYEEPYTHVEPSQWKNENKASTLPILIDTKTPYKILVSESDLSDYPAMFIKGSGNSMNAVFPKAPLSFGPDGDRSLKITQEADYIASTKGIRNFPWRYFIITENDKQLLENTMTLKLAAKNEIKDPSWIKPGQASWEWWNGACPYGPDVNFVNGQNLQTYKYYIDFASKFGVPYIILDEGWANSTADPFSPNPEVDVHELVRYGKEKNVGIILWLTWLTVHKNMNLFATFKNWGIKGVKIDFMDRSDQWMVNYYEDVAKEAAKNNLIVDFHGAFKPAGLEYRYPNVISYEGVRGMEQMSGCIPDNSLYLPFMRNAVGPMDYTPGAMISMQPEVYRSERPNSASIGTRAYQLALFVVFESGLQMLADNPTLYYKNQECTEFITQVPTTWSETKALVATAGELAVVAKRKNDTWFIGGITNGKEKERTIEITFDFLDKTKVYTMTYFEDGANADRQAMDYQKKTTRIKYGDKFKIKMSRNGGWAAILK